MLGRLLGGQQPESRAITWKSLWLTDSEQPMATMSGVTVTMRNALALSAVFDAVRLIADPICTLPIGTFIRQNGERRPYFPQPAWIEQPDPDPAVHRSDHYQAIMISLLLAGNYYGRILRDKGEIVAIAPIDPTRVEPRRNKSGFVEFVVDSETVLQSSDVVHITEMREPGALKGVSRIERLREVFGIGKALDEYVARYFTGTLASGLVLVPGDMSPEQAKTLKDEFEKNSKGLRNAHRPNILTGGAKYERVGATADEAQLTQARDFFTLEVARAFKIPPSKLGVNTPGTRAYASVEQDNIDFVTTTLRYYVYKIEEAYSRLLQPRAAFVRMNMEALLRGDQASRFTAYSQGIQSGFLSINDIHRLEDMRPVEGGDTYRVPLANVDLGAANITETQMRVEMAVQLITSGFDPEAALTAVGLPRIDHTGLPSVQLQAVDASGDTSNDNDADEQPTRMIRSVIRDEAGFITAVIDEEIKRD